MSEFALVASVDCASTFALIRFTASSKAVLSADESWLGVAVENAEIDALRVLAT